MMVSLFMVMLNYDSMRHVLSQCDNRQKFMISQVCCLFQWLTEENRLDKRGFITDIDSVERMKYIFSSKTKELVKFWGTKELTCAINNRDCLHLLINGEGFPYDFKQLVSNAIRRGNVEILDYLLLLPDNDMYDPLYIFDKLFEVLKSGHLAVFEWLLHNLGEEIIVGGSDKKPLIEAAVEGGSLSVLQRLFKMPCVFWHLGITGKHLYSAASSGNLPILKFLWDGLRNRKNLVDTDNLLYYACTGGSLPVINFVFETVLDGRRPEWKYQEEFGMDMLTIIIQNGSDDIIACIELLQKYGCPVTTDALQTAADLNQREVLEMLLSRTNPRDVPEDLCVSAVTTPELFESLLNNDDLTFSVVQECLMIRPSKQTKTTLKYFLDSKHFDPIFLDNDNKKKFFDTVFESNNPYIFKLLIDKGLFSVNDFTEDFMDTLMECKKTHLRMLYFVLTRFFPPLEAQLSDYESESEWDPKYTQIRDLVKTLMTGANARGPTDIIITPDEREKFLKEWVGPEFLKEHADMFDFKWLCVKAAEHGRFRLVEWLEEAGLTDWSDDSTASWLCAVSIAKTAASQGNLQEVDKAYRRVKVGGGELTYAVIVAAVKGKHLEILNFLADKRQFSKREQNAIAETAAEIGDFDIAKCLEALYGIKMNSVKLAKESIKHFHWCFAEWILSRCTKEVPEEIKQQLANRSLFNHKKRKGQEDTEEQASKRQRQV